MAPDAALMHRALAKKVFLECRLLLAGGTALLVAFHWLRVWIISQMPQTQLKLMLDLLPDFVKRLSPVPVEQIASVPGRIALAYDDPVVLLTVTAWAIARGSDVVSGELGRGTLEMVLAQPVRRITVFAWHVAITMLGAAILALAGWVGTALGVATVALEETPSLSVFVPLAINLFAFTYFLAAITALASACDRHRWRTIGIVGAFYVVEMVVKVVGRSVREWRWLENLTFFTAYEPQALAADAERAWSLRMALPDGTYVLGGWGYDAVLIGLGSVALVLAAAIFCHRDLPAPL